MSIELNLYQVRAMLEMLEASGDEDVDDPIVIEERVGGHSGPGLYAYFRECPEEGCSFIGVDQADQDRGNAIADSLEDEQ